MNRIVTMVLKNFPIVPGAWQKLCRYAKHPEKYSEEEMYRHIQYILKRAVRGGNIDLQVSNGEYPQRGRVHALRQPSGHVRCPRRGGDL